MAQPKLTFKTPLLPLEWVSITGKGKVKMNKDPLSEDSKDFYFTASVVYPDQATMEKDKAIFDKFWRENRPAGCTKQSYTMFKPQMLPVLDAEGKPQEDEDGAVIKKETGKWLLSAKTLTQWPDGKPNRVRILRGNGNPLDLGDKQIGNGSIGVLHGSVGINSYPNNEGLAFYLNAIQLKKFEEYTAADDIAADDLGEDEGMEGVDIDTADVSKDKPEV